MNFASFSLGRRVCSTLVVVASSRGRSFGRRATGARRPLEAQVEDYLCFLRVERNLAANTIAAYVRDLDDFQRAMEEAGRTDGQTIATADVATWARGLGQAGLAPATQKRMLVAVRGLFRFLAARYGWDTNPVADVALPKLAKPLPQVISFADVERLLTTAPLRDRALLALWYGAGLRVSEAVTLTMGAVHLDAGIIRVLGKGSKERVVPIGSAAIAILETYIVRERPLRLKGRASDFLFPGRGRTGAFTRQAAFVVIRRLAQAAGLPANISPHTLRHAFATHLVQGGADLRSVQTLLGHADLRTTEIYTHIDDQHIRKTYERTHPRA